MTKPVFKGVAFESIAANCDHCNSGIIPGCLIGQFNALQWGTYTTKHTTSNFAHF